MGKHLRPFLLTAVIALAGSLFFGASPVSAEETSETGKVTAYYFHGNFRCPTCNKMEQYSRAAIERGFKDELASGKLAFKAVNVDQKANEHYVRDYGLFTKALVLSLRKDGKEIRSKNLDKIWQLVRNRDQYESYVRDEVAAFLKEA